MKIVYRAGDITEAEIVRGMLESNQIEAHVSGYYLQGGVGDLQPTDLAKVHVSDEDYDQAREILSEYEGIRSDNNITNDKLSRPESSVTEKVTITVMIVLVVSILSYWIIGV